MPSLARRVRIDWMLVTLLAALLSGCTQDDPEQPTRSKTATTTVKAPVTRSLSPDPQNIPSDQTGGCLSLCNKKDPSALDPRHDGWTTEVFHDHVKKQLKRIGKLLHHAARLDDHKLATLVSPGFSGPSLVPDQLEPVFDDGQFLVRRDGGLDASKPSRPAPQGIEGFRQGLLGLRARLEGLDEVHTHFKIYRVSQRAEQFTTEAYFHAYGGSSNRRLQVNAKWICTWSPTDGTPDAPPRLDVIEVNDYEEVVLRQAHPLFADCTESVLADNPSFNEQLRPGVDYWSGQMDRRVGIQVNGHQGIAVGDVNGDGLEDIYICQQGGLPNRLFVQQPDGSATDVSAQAGVDLLAPTRSALLIDLDNDGDQDLVLATTQQVLLLENDGSGRFTLRATRSCSSLLYSMTAADFDNDGDLDLYVCGLRMVTSEKTIPVPFYDANNGGANDLLRNDGQWNFTNVTGDVGLESNNRRYSYASCWEDFDNDGDQDLYVANDYGRNNLYRNEGGRFVDVAAEAGVEDMAAGMSVSWGDYNADGRMDLYISNMFSSAGGRITFQPGFKQQLDPQRRAQIQRHARGNTLLENLGDGTFRDCSVDAEVTMGRWAWGSLFVDVNNDGLEDLLVANGFVTGDRMDDL